MICEVCGQPAFCGISDNIGAAPYDGANKLKWYCNAHMTRNSSPCTGCAANEAEIERLTAERDALAAKRERLREVLKKCERAGANRCCPLCGFWPDAVNFKHAAGCELAAALADDAEARP